MDAGAPTEATMWAYTIDAKLMADDVARAYRRAGFAVRTSEFRYSFPLASLQSATEGVRVQTETARDSIFAWISTSCNFKQDDQLNDPITWFGSYDIQVTDEQSGYKFLGPDRRLIHNGFVGSIGSPYILGFPYILAPGSRLTAEFFGRLPPAAGPPGEPAHLTLNGIKLFTTPYTRRVILPDVPGLEAL